MTNSEAYNIHQIVNDKYKGVVSVEELIDDAHLMNALPAEYFPKFDIVSEEGNRTLFIRNSADIYSNIDGLSKAQFLYLDKNGKLITDRETSTTQVPMNQGFLMRISVSKNNYIPQAMAMNYLVDLSKIEIYPHSTIEVSGEHAVQRDVILFNNLEFFRYYEDNIQWDGRIKEFTSHREELFDTFF